MKTKIKISFAIAIAVLSGGIQTLNAQQIEKPTKTNTPTRFAIVVDEGTFKQAKAEINAYKAALEQQGLGTYIISSKWKKPEEIRAILKKLHNEKPALEGAALIGDIPIPMIMNAQRLTSAYRLDEAKAGLKAAVPSDRFYDDFGLEFNFLSQDNVNTEQFFYSLAPSSQQVINLDIYTARIRAPFIKGKTRYESIKDYLKKVVAAKNEQNPLNTMMVYSGMGYASESETTWASEQVALREQLPNLFKPGSSAKFINSKMMGDIKSGLLAEIERKDLDLAIFHQHGYSDEQLVSGSPSVSFPQPSIENVRRYLRNKIQDAKKDGRDVEETKKRFQTTLGVPMVWMDNALVDSVVKADSVFEANGRITIDDIDKITPNARMVILDNCYNGSFHHDDYMSGHYIFGKGKTVVAMGNSINVLQDVWTTNLIGLLQHGVRIGNWFKQQPYLETHLIGDPTFTFSTKNTVDYNNAIVNLDGNNALWMELLKGNDADLQSIALYQIAKTKNEASSKLLKDTYYNSPFAATRASAFTLLSQLNTPDFASVIKDAVNDPYEYIRRKAVNLIGDFGGDEFVPVLVQSAISDWPSKRVGYNLGNSLSFMNSETVLKNMEESLNNPEFLLRKAEIQKLITKQKSSLDKVKKDDAIMADKSADLKKRTFNVTTLRTYSYHKQIPSAIKIILDGSESEALRLNATEALGWYAYSYQKDKIIAALTTLINDKQTSDKLRAEATRSLNYLKAFTPDFNNAIAAK
ncbi:HEAT repeat domain-containing protein [Pedobacter nototheniae]|uniref:HEAT repeat domain-containing protein n=1 Tax=Pedobacter nototheniae TaxID=2488994 RepID=UPI0010399DB9|nr:HEAT repeat domain-containing protein [Pedobacter nototheniae]